MNVAGFGSDPFWPILLKVVALFALLVVIIVLLTIWGERRVVARMQSGSVPTGWACCSVAAVVDGRVQTRPRRKIIPRKGGTRCVRPVRSIVPARSAASAVIPFARRSPSSGRPRCCN